MLTVFSVQPWSAEVCASSGRREKERKRMDCLTCVIGLLENDLLDLSSETSNLVSTLPCTGLTVYTSKWPCLVPTSNVSPTNKIAYIIYQYIPSTTDHGLKWSIANVLVITVINDVKEDWLWKSKIIYSMGCPNSLFTGSISEDQHIIS